jgi:ABC-type sugar transport system ATPase subunit
VRVVAVALGLAGVLERRPGTLSGGQRRRVALGRAVARRPGAFLLDEPLTGLDAPLRAAVRGDLLDLHRRTGAATLYVTHDQAEALATGDRVAVMHAGRVEQVGPPREVYERPATVFVASFIGSPPMNLILLRVFGAPGPDDREWDSPEALRRAAPRDPWAAGDVLGLRPEHVRLALDGEARDEALYWHPRAFEVVRVEYLGNETVATVLLGPHTLRARLSPADVARPGERRRVGFDLSRASWFDRTTGRSLRP